MTDQAESGASAVFAQYEAWVDQSQRRWKYDELTAFLAGYQQCRADLERVTAERDAMCEVCETVKVWKEEHWELWRPYPPEHPWQTHSTEVTPKHKSDRGLVDALARFDATRKAAADAEEEK